MVIEYHGSRNLSELRNRLHVKFVGGSLCLDLVNTVGGRSATGAAVRDKIASYQDVLGWSLLAGSLDRRCAKALAAVSARFPRPADAVFARAIQLREALYGIFLRLSQNRRPAIADTGVFSSELAAARARQRLVFRSGRFTWAFPECAHDAQDLDRVLWPVALSAAELLSSGAVANLGQCQGDGCGWMFLDTSRNRQRRWCDMKDCGNRAKVQRFRATRLPC